MAAVSINQGMPGPEESVHKVDRSRWQLLAMARRQWAEIDLPHDCRLLRTVVDEAPMLAEGLGMESGDAFLVEYLGLDLSFVRMVLAWLDHGARDDNPHRDQARADESRRSSRDRKRRQRGTDLSERPCACCGATFAPKRSDARCCSGKCRARLSRQAAKH